jgi:hypothetical protein
MIWQCIFYIVILFSFNIPLVNAGQDGESFFPLRPEEILQEFTPMCFEEQIKLPGIKNIQTFSIDTPQYPLSEEEVRLLAQFPFAQLKSLRLTLRNISAETIKTLFQAPWMDGLEFLSLRIELYKKEERGKGATINSEDAIAKMEQIATELANKKFPHLKHFSLSIKISKKICINNLLPSIKISKKICINNLLPLLASSWLAQLQSLSLSQDIDENFIEQLASVPFHNLKSLSLASLKTVKERRAIKALLKNASWLPNLEKLDLASNDMADWAPLLAVIPFKKLTHLNLHDNQLNSVTMEKILRAPWMANVQYLDIRPKLF